MITQINLGDVASYRNTTTLNTDKKVNIIYGLNGTGKSTFSNYFYAPDDPKYKDCSHTNDGCKVLVYNQKFIQDNFYSKDSIDGIFSLSKENKEAKEKVEQLGKDIDQLSEKSKGYQADIDKQVGTLKKAKDTAEKKAWEIKTNYSGGDRVLKFCLERLMGNKTVLFDHLVSVPLPAVKPIKTIEQLKEEAAAIDGDKATTYTVLPKISLSELLPEELELLKEIVIGNEDSPIAKLINQLQNSDWVSNGLQYLADIEDETCPFCQSKTITPELITQIKDYFDETYEESKQNIGKILTKYQKIVDSLIDLETYKTSPFSIEFLAEMTESYASIAGTLKSNLLKVQQKEQTPSLKVELEELSEHVASFNKHVDAVNASIGIHNQKIANSTQELKRIKDEFWKIVRWEYDQTIKGYESSKKDSNDKIIKLKAEKENVDTEIVQLEAERTEQQKQTVNIDDSIKNINKGLVDIGITDFHIEKHEKALYRLVRTGTEGPIFLSLSEGEKMIISFLYFRELFKGKQTADEAHVKKIAVIDDPVSSLSHIFVYNIGQLIKNDFFNGDGVEQVFVLTHSLYFFYELVDSNHKRRKENQSLYRLSKNTKGTTIEMMKYEEVQNDYQSYWSVINDKDQPAALIANCMRNVVEYFFNFVQKSDLSNVMQKQELQDVKYQAFIRYINRESHSLGQNIIDFKEFDYGAFREGLRLLFEITGYPEHYQKMSQI
ncbi:AAA family ATPase [Vibrio vulnificus]|uniref:Protein CR006 P-loop domain-containing protein n=1 Tax=Vibrio vulnificus TaxID=672 RepID=A0A2S3QYS4_VIBVL|nr:AAA family ATPase [Vibrio vulnificus]EHZ7122023.1 AAA family ATPase [Vibrio vulnificus]EIU7744663.1 AAA family ATPase [Vibrio vulnificus]EJN6714083.1 AAA family ATPase [Vibrio vulnificus]EJQ9990421.1 AAA family ATPase [Vibrio vulnificus]EJV9412494.1 AAA family ATPase [Vibrio vulnificus]